MLKRLANICCLLSLVVVVKGQDYTVSGKVIDVVSKKPLAFVNIMADNNAAGTTTDIDGKFEMRSTEPISKLVFSYVGYRQQTLEPRQHRNNVVSMQRTDYELREVVILPGINPAHRIIRQATANRDLNNPEKLASFSYTSYNKMIFTAHYDSMYINDWSKRMEMDTMDQAVLEFFDKQHLMMMEFVSERKFMAPDRNHEKVIASRVSGLQDPSFTMLATEMQSFSFYPDYITIYDKKYLNPITKGSTSKYLFVLEDTAYAGKDTVFIISYRPKRGKNFEGMMGLLYINSDGYAIQNVIAEPTQENKDGIDVKIQQQYQKLGESWFPVKLNTDIIYNMFEVGHGRKVIGIGRSYLKDIRIRPELKKREFNSIELEIDEKAGRKSPEFWDMYRTDSLTMKEKNTYHYVDSIGKANKLDLKMKAMESLLSGRFPVKFIDLDLDKLMDYNEYEGFRFGAGIHTNGRISRFVTVGAYYAYGLKDKGHKFGGDAEILFHRRSNFRLNYRYFNDVIESAGISFPFYQPNLFVSESFRKFLIRKMDKIEKGELALSFHALQYFDLRFSANQHIRKATDAYTFANEISSSVTYNQKEFFFSEAVFGFRFAYKEKFALTPGKQRISLGTKYPILWGQVTKGFKGDNLGGEFDYFRYDLKIQETFLTKNIGKTVIQFNAGLIDGNLPYIALYNGRGSFVQFNLSAANSFETMRLNEFLSDRYIALFLSHDFEKLLFRTKRFQPKIMLTSNIGFGSLDNAAQHENIDFNTMEKGYYESGLIINNLLKLSFTGIGVGGFYRYGPYANKDFEDNAALKFTVTFEL